MTALNATSSIAAASLPTPAIALIVFIILGLTLFLIFKNFRRMCYGLAVLVPVSGLGWISWGVGSETNNGNLMPITIIGVSIATIIISMAIGKILENFKWVKKIEGSLSEQTKENKEDE